MSAREELFQLLNQQVECPLLESQQVRLNELLRSDDALVDDYVHYMAIHGQLFWDAGMSATPVDRADATPASTVATSNRFWLSVIAATLIAGLGLWAWSQSPQEGVVEIADDETNSSSDIQQPVAVATNTEIEDEPVVPLKMNNARRPPVTTNGTIADVSPSENLPSSAYFDGEFTDNQVVGLIDKLLASSWAEHSVIPSAVASDHEWLRRVYLTYTGRIPTLEESEEFADYSDGRKYSDLINQIVDDKERASYLAVVWTNLLVGRTEKRGVNREKLFDYLVDMFDNNKPWMQTVDELITASGRNDQNGATNFLLAHLNNQATPATAVTARLFLGQQISCVQCHDHPFAKGIKQQEYWALNAFFKDTTQKSVPLANNSSKGQKKLAWTLTDRSVEASDEDRMTYFANRSGLQNAVLPAYDGETLPATSNVNRRKQLAKMLASDSHHKVAASMVNRMWSHFFGFGFTAQVDDMGPHSTVSQPELLRLLTEAFVKSNYDVKRLMTWIGQSKAWRLGSTLTADNDIDRPDDGEMPLFSRVYVRRMTPEQVYESIRVAIRSAAGQPVPDAVEYSQHRRAWVRQFAKSFDTDENDESLEFDGTIAQAMVMMNGAEVGEAIELATQSILGDGRVRKPIDESLDLVAMAMLTRDSTAAEEKAFRSHFRQLSQKSPTTALPAAMEDMMWAYLNSSEFQLVH